MAGFENYTEDAREIEQEIVRKGIALGIDWNDDIQVRALAREAFEHLQDDTRRFARNPLDFTLKSKVDLYGLAALMLRTMEESAGHGFLSHGGAAWKAFARALWIEANLRDPD